MHLYFRLLVDAAFGIAAPAVARESAVPAEAAFTDSRQASIPAGDIATGRTLLDHILSTSLRHSF